MSSSQAVDRALKRLAFRINFGFTCRAGGIGFGIGLAVGAAGVLIAKAGFNGDPDPVWSLLPAGVGLIAGTAWAIGGATKPESLLSLADARLGAGGVLMGGGGEDEHAIAIESLRIGWTGRPALRSVMFSAAFLALVLFLPTTVTRATNPLDLTPDIEQVASQIDALDAAEVIEEDEVRTLTEALEELATNDDGLSPGAAWEAMDRAREQVRERGRQGEQTLTQRAAQSAAVKAISDAARNLPPEAAEKLLDALRDAVRENGQMSDAIRDALEDFAKAARENADRQRAQGGNGNQGGSQGQPGAGQGGGQSGMDQAMLDALQRLGEAAGLGEGAAGEGLKALVEAGLADAEALERLAQGRAAALDELAKLLGPGAAGEGPMGLEDFLNGLGQRPGSGGITRGPGHVVLTQGDETDAKANTPEGVSSVNPDRDQSVVVSETARTPEGEDLMGEGSSGGALSGEQASQGSGRPTRVLPRHRDGVRKYFERDTNQRTPENSDNSGSPASGADTEDEST